MWMGKLGGQSVDGLGTGGVQKTPLHPFGVVSLNYPRQVVLK